MNEEGGKEEDKEKKEKKPLSKAEIQFMILTDLLFRSPLFAILVLVILGSLAAFFIWFIMHVLVPAVKNSSI